jgi:hypothetical protein
MSGPERARVETDEVGAVALYQRACDGGSVEARAYLRGSRPG